MPSVLGVPLHPALAHFPIAAAVFGALALLVGTVRPPSSGLRWREGGAALLLAALVFTVPSILTGHAWAEALGRLPAGSWLPGAEVSGGVLRKHVLLAAASAASLLAAVPLALMARHPKRSPGMALLAAVLAALLLLATGHHGATMVYRPAPGPAARP